MGKGQGLFINSVEAPLVLCDADWRPVDANDAAVAALGFPSIADLCAGLVSLPTSEPAIHSVASAQVLLSRVTIDGMQLLQCAPVRPEGADEPPPLVRLYAEAFRASPTPTMIADRRDRTPIEMNPAWFELLDYDEEQLEDIEADDIWVYPEDRRQYYASVGENRGYASGFETVLRSRTGEEIPVQIFSRLIDPGSPLFAVTVLIDLRARRRYENELLEESRRVRISESKLDAIFRNSPTPTYLFDPQANQVLELNEAAVALTGYTRESARDLDQLWVNQAERAEFHRIREIQRVDGFPATLRRSDGEHVRILLYRDLIDSGDSTVSVIQMVDISALSESEERFERLFRYTPTPAVLLDLNSKILDANVAAERLFGMSREQMRAGATRRWVDLAVRDRFVREITRTGAVSDFPAEFFVASGGTVPTLVHGQVVTQGGTQELLLQFVDLTEKESYELERAATLAQLEQAQELARIGSFTWDIAAAQIDLSPQLAEMLRVAPGKHQPDVLLARVNVDDRDRIRGVFTEMFTREGERLSAEYEVRVGDADTIVCRTVGVLRVHRERAYIIGVSQDITEQHKAEQARLNFEAGVQHTQKLESLGVLAGGIAHDFNNLLTGILGNTELALRVEGLPEAARHSLETVFTASQRASDLTNQLLVYSGKGKFDMAPLDLGVLVQDISGLLHLSISGSGALVLDCEPGLNGIRADRSQVQQIVMNLIINASEALPEGRGNIEVRTRAVSLTAEQGALYDGVPAGDYICLRVSDDGVGMSPEVKERIFEPFFTSKFAGRGLGMAAVMGIVRAHHGGICIESGPGVGTSVWVVFPALDFAVSPESVKQSATPRQADLSATVLVVDDDELIREYAARLLRTSGYRTLVASSAAEALERAQDASVLLLDVTMPGMSGLDVLAALESQARKPPVVMMSGYGEGPMEGARYSGVMRFVAKPFTANVVLDAVSEVLLADETGSAAG